MKALILAAGMGTRLAPYTEDRPKSMVEVNGVPIIFNQIKAIQKAGIDDITIVSGYKAEYLEEKVKASFDGIDFIRSTDYLNTNNMYSAFLAEKCMNGFEFIMMNADVFFEETLIEELCLADYSDAIVTEVGNYLEESMKVIYDGKKIIHISKQIPPEEAYGTSIDVYKFSAGSGEQFFEKCRSYIDQNQKKLWSEVALDGILNNAEFQPFSYNGKWVEIDNIDDLKKAEDIF